MMPNMDGFELTRRLRQDPRTATVSVIMLTARGLSADKLEGFAIGADDYIVEALRHARAAREDPRGAAPREGDARAVPAHRSAGQRARSRRRSRGAWSASEPFAILYVDLDHFKAYNDHYGFMRGDEAIQATAR